MAQSQDEWQDTIRGLVAGDEQVCARFWSRYGAQLKRVAQRHLPVRLQQRIEPDDIVQSACRSFFRRVQQGSLELADSDMLGPLLCAITLNKVRMKARFHGRKRRDPQREERIGGVETDDGRIGNDPANVGLAPDEVVMFGEQLKMVLASLDEEECAVVQLKLAQCTNREIADRMLCSERTVRRIMQRIRTRLREILSESAIDSA